MPRHIGDFSGMTVFGKTYGDKAARLKEVNILLSLDQKENMDFDDKDAKKNCVKDREER